MAIALLVIGAQIVISFPGMVPISLQTLAIYVIAMTFNKNQALMMTLVYLFMGAIGLPVFANFTGGIDHLIGPNGGFLLAFPIMAYVISWFVHNYDHKLRNLVGMIVGTDISYSVGCGYFMYLTKPSFNNSFLVCVLPFLVGDALTRREQEIPHLYRWRDELR
ncbi:MAG: biotin transporter BioY [Sharpea porci]|uniref:biotin transporter BioY n=1 Tax=Sharpea porci TaxID=2652286 RepID=UPI00240A714B|nr:biotin transporter BioY [Sharpea porci]MDD6712330.1 biotin transporter BioY [Sharpea porci]